MADGTKAGGDAPRTLFSLGRSGKRKGRVAEPSPLEDYPPRHAEESTGDTVATLAPDTEVEAAHDDPVDAEGTDGPDEAAGAEPTDEAATSEPCPSCSLPLVPGAMFCGECGTRVIAPEDAAPTGVLLDDEVPGEPLPPNADGAFEVAQPVTGSLADDDALDDDLADDDDHEIEESAVFGAFIGADEDLDGEPEAELVDADVEPEAELDPDGEPESELVGEDGEPEAELVDADVEPEAELVEEDPEAATESDDHDGAVVPIVVGAAAGAGAAELASADAAEAAPLESAAASTTSGGSGGGSKKGVWIGAAAAAAAVVLIVGVVALGGGSKSASKNDDQVAAGLQKTTTTTAAASTTASTATTEAPTTTAGPGTTDTTASSSTVTTAGQIPSTTKPSVGTPGLPPPPPPASPASVQVSCPGTLASPSSSQIVIYNTGGTATSFLLTWSALKTGVSVSPTTGSVGAHSSAVVNVNVAPGTPGSGSRVIIKWSGGSTSCNLLVQ